MDAIEIAGTALNTHQAWLNAISNNIANVNTAKSTTGNAFQAEYLQVSAVENNQGVQVDKVVHGSAAGKLVYDPSHPDANAQGYVRMPNVDTVTEMVDLIDAQRSYEANVTAMSASKQMFAKTLEILR